ncbi:ATP synthase F1 subunit delta [Rubrobacter aplysinae]|uniref:ATP synthase F1 subunit delta n=1 Tax=Rubrobacter aplysinae TaxID=909625 RepID=UPI00064BF922|nr:ATP synthase F1 subunit delta [Rubrobacter aplysinae]
MSAASTYAEALFGAAVEREELEQTLEDLQGFIGSLGENDELRLFYHSTQLPESQKRRAIDGLTERMTLSSRNFLKLLSDNDRTEIVEDAVRSYESMVEEHLSRMEVELVTAVEVSEERLGSIKERLGKILEGREVLLRQSVDPGLIGGAVFKFGGRRVDGSVRAQLERLRDKMLERGVASG